eukprot:TRINITY_DN3589_c0_g1_i5.p2 TRINITY_DN3589_c0_g1~~TRINITY_DN3589_c0_g1_i5.p2  ORF type:complete len:407 (+),score=74.20 TRINITY_DN3589_c0_g1_i5:1728-2948(+)
MQVWLVLIKHKSGAELMKYPSIFWATTSVLYTDYPEEFLYTIRVLTAWLQRVEPDKKDVAAALTSSASNDAYGPFLGLQMMSIKGLLHPMTEIETRNLLLLLLPLSSTPLVEPHLNPRRRYLTSLAGLVPWMVSTFSAARAEVGAAQELLTRSLEQSGLSSLATTIRTFDSGFADDDEFFEQLADGIAKAFFPAEEEYLVSLLVETLRLGNAAYRPAVVQMLRALVHHVNWDSSPLRAQDVALFNPLLSYPATDQSLPLFALLLSRIPVPVDIVKSDHIGIVERMCDFDKPSRTWASADKGKNLISNGMFAVVGPLEGGNKLPKPPKMASFVPRKQLPGQEPSQATSNDRIRTVASLDRSHSSLRKGSRNSGSSSEKKKSKKDRSSSAATPTAPAAADKKDKKKKK